MGSRSSSAFPLHQAVLLGLAHGPAELLPVSSSGHITLIPWLAGWSYPELDPGRRKSFEVALHAGTAAALLITERREVARAARELDGRRAALIALSFLPPALAGFTLEHQIERRLGTPATIAGGLLAGSAAMALADVRGGRERRREDAGALDGLLLGLAQTCALVPGVSRNGATLAAARARGFNRADANILSRHCALPIILGAVALRLRPVLRSGRRAGDADVVQGGDATGSGAPRGPGRAGGERLREEAAGRIAAGALAAFVSTLGSSWLIGQVERDRSLLPYAAYRTVVAGVVIRRLRKNQVDGRRVRRGRG
ncbi:MAG TPA: undecaprenyl-diphosphate phosphatase [Solirubrobacteraceae bacterium]|nr:undecaprenyl-diphosphate phosphatase [Solirubrobacteraceae bacterium]